MTKLTPRAQFIEDNLSSIAAALAAKPSQAKKPAIDTRSKATFDLDPATIQTIRDIAADLGVPVYAVAQKLFDHALKEYELGQLELRRKAVTTQWRLE
jgi:hypothetical protein